MWVKICGPYLESKTEKKKKVVERERSVILEIWRFFEFGILELELCFGLVLVFELSKESKAKERKGETCVRCAEIYSGKKYKTKIKEILYFEGRREAEVTCSSFLSFHLTHVTFSVTVLSR